MIVRGVSGSKVKNMTPDVASANIVPPDWDLDKYDAALIISKNLFSLDRDLETFDSFLTMSKDFCRSEPVPGPSLEGKNPWR